MIRRLPFGSLDKVKPSGPRNTGHRYMTRTTTICPGPPGLYCQVLVTSPFALKVRVGAAVLVVENEPTVCTSIISLVQSNTAVTCWQTRLANPLWVVFAA